MSSLHFRSIAVRRLPGIDDGARGEVVQRVAGCVPHADPPQGDGLGGLVDGAARIEVG